MTVTVVFPDGPRRVGAHVELSRGSDSFGMRRSGFDDGPSRLVPDPKPGWRFHEIVGGKWVAVSSKD